VTVDQYFAYLNTTYPNDGLTRGQLAGAAYRVKQYQAEGFSLANAIIQGKFNPVHVAKLTAKGELTNFNALT
jgi:CRISPR/Cas system-associated endonuclease Cas1